MNRVKAPRVSCEDSIEPQRETISILPRCFITFTRDVWYQGKVMKHLGEVP